MKWKSREVFVGNVAVGGDNPVRIQSMTTTNTRDAQATAEQIMRLSDEGCEIARVTVQGKKEAESCEAIKNLLIQKNYTIPLVADIHFYPPAAMLVADFVDKIRINPGNFVDRRATFKEITYTDASYRAEIEKIEEGFSPLVEKCKKLKRALRIGTNHGSLSDRIMNRYGDTPKGMVESAFEFTRIARKMDFHDIIFSMKASNPLVMIEAYRLLMQEMRKNGWDYPLHLGVTEAGEGEDGRIKSAVGIGSLLLDGIGDTIRVSLTEDPWQEIDPCKRLVSFAKNYPAAFSGEKRERSFSEEGFLHPNGTVILEVHEEISLDAIGAKGQLGQAEKSFSTADALYFEKLPEDEKLLKKLAGAKIGILSKEEHPLATPVIEAFDEEPKKPYVLLMDESSQLLGKKPLAILFKPKKPSLKVARAFFAKIPEEIPVILFFSYEKDVVIQASAEMGALLADGFGEGILISCPLSLREKYTLSFSLLQASRMRTVKTEFISCPGCGRTLFELQEVSKRIREKTDHLPGVKIAIMGCIVNGPGEMADADFGYVGSRPGKIDLYVGKECVERNIDFSDADDRLIALIKAHGKWVEKEEVLLC